MSALDQFRQSFDAMWDERSAQERKLLTFAALFALAALVYSLLVSPALSGREELDKEIPQLRQQAAQMKALLQEAQGYQNQGQNPVPPVTKEALDAMLTQRGLPAAGVTVTSDFTKVQLSNVPFANVITWVSEAQKVHHLLVQEATIVAQPTAGNVNANLTFRQIGQ